MNKDNFNPSTAAPLISRLFAAIIDIFIAYIITIFITENIFMLLGFSKVPSGHDMINQIATQSLVHIIVIGTGIIFCWKKYNKTPGKAVMGIKIVDDITLKSPSLSQYVIRFVAYIFIPLMFICSFNKRRKAAQDYIASTIVVIDSNSIWHKINRTK